MFIRLAKAGYRIEVFQSEKNGEWFRRTVCIANGEITDSSQGVKNRIDAMETAYRIGANAGWPVVEK